LIINIPDLLNEEPVEGRDIIKEHGIDEKL
jgi:hypothetical protein